MADMWKRAKIVFEVSEDIIGGSYGLGVGGGFLIDMRWKFSNGCICP